MKKITLFLASSAELKPEREQFEIEIYRKSKAWTDKGVFLHLDIWEDLSARMGAEGSQSEYNKKVEEADLFILLAYTKVGMYTGEEFEKAFGQFKSKEKPFIFTYFKTPDGIVTDPSLEEFHQKLKALKHFYSPFKDSSDLWNQFNRELDRLVLDGFTEFKHPGDGNMVNVSGDGNIVVSGNTNSTVSINTGNTTNQTADKIYNIDKIDTANFS
ncbi:MAG: hypothetical protein K9J37_14690 [Saprospiraceae bacterium]|nr:hypothetical protein [Saprospiraceae bacterium]MCF8251155.1 hypothetical protein [Saprospiraceae bacterium]MCF8281878.1 hypothetical protein [Bacteroidales bacterium]MCF8312967.1 hypothetical protein [Saprospiraceae bacterium]MCF8441414.1 hypothetical protein [Saprospiraceae bacterium]